MANSTTLTVDNTAWLSVATATEGYFTNNSSHSILFVENATQPAASVSTGHILTAKNWINFLLAAGQTMWIKGTITTNQTGTLTIG